jgi:hypothetical protein
VIKDGFEFHYAVAWADLVAEMEHLSDLLGLPLTVF